MSKNPKTYFSTTIEKGLKILSLFNQDRNKSSLAQISRLTGINKTSTYRFVNTFIELGYLRKNPDTKMISLGPTAIALGHGLLRGFDLLEVIKPIVDQAVKAFKTTVDVALLDGDVLMIIYRREMGNTLTFRLPTVTRSLHCSAIGKSVLAFLPEHKLAEMIKPASLVRKTPNSIVNTQKLKAELGRIREQGYALNKEEYIVGLIAIAAPLINVSTQAVVGAVSFDFSTPQISIDEVEKRYSESIIDVANEISQVLPLL
jgi:IclR family pca regulon transcriptional regulator